MLINGARACVQCNIPRTPAGVGALIHRYPLVLLCKPVRCNDKFWRQAIDLAAFTHRFGHCRVPDDATWRSLARFVERQRIIAAEGRLEQEKADVLANLQFDFGGEVRRSTPRRYALVLVCTPSQAIFHPYTSGLPNETFMLYYLLLPNVILLCASSVHVGVFVILIRSPLPSFILFLA
jgi:hypothetical protein